VSISVEAGLTAYYTLNGGAETKYTAPFTVSETTTVVAYAMDADGNKSSMVTNVITIANIGNLVGSGTTADPYNVASAMALINAGLAPTEKVYVKGIVTKIDEIGTSFGNATYWIGDTANDGNPLQVYRGYGLGGEKIETADYLKVGDNVIVGGTLILYGGTTPEFTTSSEIYELNGEKVGEKETTAYESISAIKAAATATKEPASLKLDNLLVSYVNGNYTYVTDGTEGFLLFGTTGVKAGDKLAGTATGDLYLYNGLPEMALTSADGITVVSSGNEVSVPVYELGDVQGNGMRYSNLLVKFDGVYFNASALTDKNVSIEQDGNEVTLRDNFNLLTGVEFDTEALYTFTAIVAIYNGAVQLYPINRADFVTEAPYDFVGDGTAENPYTVADVQHFDVTTASAPVWVKGIIVGCANSTLKNFYPVVEGVEAVATNVLLAATAGETNVDKCIPVNLANSPAAMKAVRETLNVLDHAENIGKEVIVHGTIEKYFSVAGVKNVDDAIIDGTEVNSIAGVNTDAVRAQGIYTIAGQRVNNVTRGGLYIIGGQKVLVK
ncbi:MAG: chitobiase/beta-hexosaminidase C-terminal domain-containing protein, partial [Prevotellaceae bacterium]|nr:chitobiase/beta-hexosaminidase C-terminal domain-containing protein [Prevotellaceae bacterium]